MEKKNTILYSMLIAFGLFISVRRIFLLHKWPLDMSYESVVFTSMLQHFGIGTFGIWAFLMWMCARVRVCVRLGTLRNCFDDDSI